MTINDLLENKMFRFNQSYLAKTLNIQRGTLRKYKDDLDGLHHFVRESNDGSTFELFTNQSEKIT